LDKVAADSEELYSTRLIQVAYAESEDDYGNEVAAAAAPGLHSCGIEGIASEKTQGAEAGDVPISVVRQYFAFRQTHRTLRPSMQNATVL
jgi:hypothetical protein